MDCSVWWAGGSKDIEMNYSISSKDPLMMYVRWPLDWSLRTGASASWPTLGPEPLDWSASLVLS